MANNTSADLIFPGFNEYNEGNIHTFSKEAFVIVTVITTAILILAIPANILVLLGYLKTSSALKKPANYLMVNLTIAELILALVVIPLQLLVHFIKPHLVNEDGTLCVVVGALTYPFYIVVVLTMICISVDRYYAIRAPLNYKFKISGNRIAYMIAYTWFHSGAFIIAFGFALGVGFNRDLAMCGIFWDKNMALSGFGAIIHIVVPFFLLLFLNVNLVLSLRNQNRTAVINLDRRRNQIWRSRQVQERRITSLVFWIITTYLLCWLPYLVTRALWVLLSRPTSAMTSTIATISLQLSVVIDPLLNLVFRKDLRATIERLLLRRRNESVTIQSGRFNAGISRITENSHHNTRIFVRPKSENLND